MSKDDPFFVVRDEVQQAMMTARSLFLQWQGLQERGTIVSPEERDYITNELRNSLRSIDWDLEDLEETVVEKNPKKFKIDEFELNDRRNFIERTRSLVQDIRHQMTGPETTQMNGNHETSDRQGLLSSNGISHPQESYAHLEAEVDRADQQFLGDMLQQQQQSLIPADSGVREVTSCSTGILRNTSHQVGNDLEDQSALLDELGQDVEPVETRISWIRKRITSIIHMSNDKRQWCAIGVLITCIIIALVLFFVL